MVTDPKYTIRLNQIDVLLCNPTIREKIYEELHINESDLPYPVRSVEKSNYIYGFLSDSVHSPDFRTLWLRDDEDEQIAQYAIFLANRYAMRVDSFDREGAAAGCNDVMSETQTAAQSLQSSGPHSFQSSGKSSTGTGSNVPTVPTSPPAPVAVRT